MWRDQGIDLVGRGGGKSNATRQSTQCLLTHCRLYDHIQLCGISVLKGVFRMQIPDFCGHQAQGCSRIKPAPKRGDWHILHHWQPGACPCFPHPLAVLNTILTEQLLHTLSTLLTYLDFTLS